MIKKIWKIIKNSSIIIIIALIMLTIFFETTSVIGDPSIDTTISIDPLDQTVKPGENFTVDVYCVPDQPIKAFALKISFNPSRVKAINVTEGDIFNGHFTHFDPGIINNNVGTISDIYGLILGLGNVSDPGTFVTISFIAKETSGTYSLDIADVGVTNEIGYISIDVSNGIISIQGTNNNPPSQPAIPYGDGNEDNNQPDAPLMPSGPTFVEKGVEYTYSSSTYDIDEDKIKYIFDWGDGSFSKWSDFVASNITVSMSHTFTSTSTYEVRVMAQDENGLNSSWSPALNVIVLEAISGGKPPVANISVSGNLSVNETIFFDGSGSFDEDGVIVFYYWDFGDGTNGSGINISHTYHKPGKYPVTLVVTDNDGNTYSKTILVTVSKLKTVFSEIEEEQLGEDQSVIPFDFGIIFIVFTIVLLTCLTVLLRDNIKIFTSSFSHYIRLFLNWKIWDTLNFIKKRDESIVKIRNTRLGGLDLKQSPFIKPDNQSYKINYFKEKSDKPAEVKIPVDKFYVGTSEGVVSKDIESQIDDIIYREKVDKPAGVKIPVDKFYVGTSEGVVSKDIESQIDDIILSNGIEHLEKFEIEKERMLSKLESNDIERMVDDLFESKMQQEIDNL